MRIVITMLKEMNTNFKLRDMEKVILNTKLTVHGWTITGEYLLIGTFNNNINNATWYVVIDEQTNETFIIDSI